MQARMKRHHTKGDLCISEVEMEQQQAITVADYYKQSYGDFPRGAILLSGLRNREGLTQLKLGEMIGVAQHHISRMERGKRAISKAIAKKLATLFKTDYRIFL
jgi:DNA-binding XRE family transcriptional regulator